MGTVVGSWRLRILLILVIFATSIYTCYSIFGNIEASVMPVNSTEYNTSQVDVSYNDTDFGTSESTGFTDVLFGLGDFLTFGSIDNDFVRIFLNGVMSIAWITIGYIIFTFIKEWIPFV